MKTMLQSILKNTQYILLTALGALLVACGDGPKDKIIGKWQSDYSANSFLDFFPDGTVTMQDTDKFNPITKTDTVSGTWMILEDGRLKMTFTVMGMSNTRAVKLTFPSKDKMQHEGDDRTRTYARKKS
jgi:hypothetical protein